MKRLLSSAFAIVLVMGVPALAAPSDFSNQKFAQRDRDDGRGGERGGPRSGPEAGPRGNAQGTPNRGFRPNDDRGRDRGNARRPVEHGPAQFERRAFQRNFNAPRRFRAGAFRPPPGWRYRRWVYGDFLPRAYWAQPYWITNFWLYDLDRPPLGCEWVRSGPDALLVDSVTGEILQVQYNAFY